MVVHCNWREITDEICHLYMQWIRLSIVCRNFTVIVLITHFIIIDWYYT